jgi:hypothetical protein
MMRTRLSVANGVSLPCCPGEFGEQRMNNVMFRQKARHGSDASNRRPQRQNAAADLIIFLAKLSIC